MTDYDYDRQKTIRMAEDLAEVRLSGPTTLELTAWDDGDFRLVAYHTIRPTYPFEADDRGEAAPFYRERIAFATSGDEEGWFRHEVVRRQCGETGWQVVHSERFGGYTLNWPAPLEDDEEDEDEDSPGFRYPYQGRFA